MCYQDSLKMYRLKSISLAVEVIDFIWYLKKWNIHFSVTDTHKLPANNITSAASKTAATNRLERNKNESPHPVRSVNARYWHNWKILNVIVSEHSLNGAPIHAVSLWAILEIFVYCIFCVASSNTNANAKFPLMFLLDSFLDKEREWTRKRETCHFYDHFERAEFTDLLMMF